MNSRGLSFAFASLLAAFTLGFAPAVSATCLERAGGEDDGIGGMGRGGDGDDDGIGGMGIYGTITGFGSICLNGMKVEVPDDLRVGSPFGERSADVLRVGHVVSIDARRDGDQWVAESIVLQPGFAGTVEGEGTQTVILGVPVDASVDDGGVQVVYGVRGPHGAMQISLVEPEAQLREARVWGFVSSTEEGTQVGGVPVRFESTEGFAEGDRVEVTGSYDASQNQLTATGWRETHPIVPERRRQSLELVVYESAGRRALFLDGEPVALAARADIEDVALGETVYVRAERDGAGGLRIDSIMRPNPQPATSRAPGTPGHPGQGPWAETGPPGQAGSTPRHRGELPASASSQAHAHASPGGRAPVAAHARPDRGGRPDRPEKPMRPERPAKPDRPTQRVERPERPDRPDRPDRPTVLDRASRPDRPVKPERPDPPGRNR